MSSLRNVLPCTFLNYEFAVQTRFCIEPLTSCQSNEFAYRKLASSGCHGCQVQNRHGGRWFHSVATGLSRKFCFITDCIALTSHRAVVFFLFLIISTNKLKGYPPYAASFSCSFLIRFLMLYPINNRPISTLTFSVPRT